MSLEKGQKLGPYEIEAPAGADFPDNPVMP
jgi:hypothetical protein